jgi:hypothetical protein
MVGIEQLFGVVAQRSTDLRFASVSANVDDLDPGHIEHVVLDMR